MMVRATRLAKEVGARLRKKGATLALAESCTGGLIGHWMTNIPGSSDYFLGGVVSYADKVKVRQLRVPASVIKRQGAVSRESAAAMARGVRRTFGADVAVATTGIAGPAGGTAQKPVGLVYLALCDRRRCRAEKKIFKGSRLQIKQKGALWALQSLKKFLG